MAAAHSQPRLLIPALKPFYDWVVPLSWAVIRFAVACESDCARMGQDRHGSDPGFLKAFVDLGFDPPQPYFWSSFTIEFIGGICILVGLFTRFFAAAAAIELLIITIVYWKTGFSWLNRGYEYTLLWGLVCFAIALRGGGPYSLDRKLGREL